MPARPALRGERLGNDLSYPAGADGANREFGKMIAQGGHVTPSIESNPLTACTRIGILRFLEAAEGSEKSYVYSEMKSLKQPSYKVEMHKCGVDHDAAETSGGVSMSASRLSAIVAAATFTEFRARWA